MSYSPDDDEMEVEKLKETIRKLQIIVDENDASKRRIIDRGLPPLGDRSVSNTTTHKSQREPSFEFKVPENSKFSLLDDYKKDKLEPITSSIWQQFDLINLSWSNEMSIQVFVKNVLDDILGITGMKDLRVFYETHMTVKKQLRPDLLVFSSKGSPIGVCEVKTPSRNRGVDLDSTEIKNQIFNYMSHLRNMHGVETVFGITSTYNEWRIHWLKEANSMAQATCNIENIVPEHSSSEEILYCSKIYQREDTELIEVLASTIAKMKASKIVAPKTILEFVNDERRKFGVVDKRSFQWGPLPKGIKNLLFDLPDPHTKHFYFIRDYHGGRDGRVWLAISSTGNLAVLKIAPTDASDDHFKNEIKMWREVWKVKGVKDFRLSVGHVLMMPFAFHAKLNDQGTPWFAGLSNWYNEIKMNDDFESSLVECQPLNKALWEKYVKNPLLAAKEAITGMARANYKHEDIKWQHVALLPFKDDDNKWTMKPILIDLYETSSIKKDQIEITIEESMEALKV